MVIGSAVLEQAFPFTAGMKLSLDSGFITLKVILRCSVLKEKSLSHHSGNSLIGDTYLDVMLMYIQIVIIVS